MSDPLNPYPGNLRRHIVDNSDLQVLILRTNDMEGLEHVRDIYEAARAKDAELIQKLVDALDWYVKEDDVMEGGEWDEMNAPWIEGRNEAEKVLAAADARGFKPTEQ